MVDNSIGQVRPYAEDDRPAVVLLWNITFADDPTWNEPHSVIDTKMKIQPELFLVYESGGAVVGTVLAGFDGFRGWIHHLAVDPGFQGRSISRALMEAAEAGLRDMGCRKVNLQVRAGNTAAAEKYAHMGFSEESRISMGKLL